jgi:hypothetical protein
MHLFALEVPLGVLTEALEQSRKEMDIRQTMWKPLPERKLESLTKASTEPNKMAQFTGILLPEKRLSRAFLHDLPDSQRNEIK